MALTPTQLTTFKADILANTNQVVIDALAAGDAGVIATWYNLETSPDYFIYRALVPAKEVSDAIHLDELVNITAADSDRVLKIFNIRSFDGGEFHGDNASDRAAFDDVFSSAAGDASQQAIAALWSRLARNIEVVFALSTGTGADAANADTTEVQGAISFSDVANALNS